MGRTGEAVRRLTRRGFKPTWSPDGREIAFTTENADLDPQNTLGLSSLWIADVASGQERQLANVDAVLPSWSPHGHRIAYTTRGAIAGSTRTKRNMSARNSPIEPKKVAKSHFVG